MGVSLALSRHGIGGTASTHANAIRLPVDDNDEGAPTNCPSVTEECEIFGEDRRSPPRIPEGDDVDSEEAETINRGEVILQKILQEHDQIETYRKEGHVNSEYKRGLKSCSDLVIGHWKGGEERSGDTNHHDDGGRRQSSQRGGRGRWGEHKIEVPSAVP